MNNITGLKTKSDFAKVIAAAMVGNALEFYDLFIYGFLAIVIAKVFFPAGSEIVSLLITVATFGASYIMRPLGAVVLGQPGSKSRNDADDMDDGHRHGLDRFCAGLCSGRPPGSLYRGAWKAAARVFRRRRIRH